MRLQASGVGSRLICLTAQRCRTGGLQGDTRAGTEATDQRTVKCHCAVDRASAR